MQNASCDEPEGVAGRLVFAAGLAAEVAADIAAGIVAELGSDAGLVLASAAAAAVWLEAAQTCQRAGILVPMLHWAFAGYRCPPQTRHDEVPWIFGKPNHHPCV